MLIDLNDFGSFTVHLSDPENDGFNTNQGRIAQFYFS